MIFHIAFRKAYLEARKSGVYTHPSLEQEGFIHCSTREQVEKTAARHFKPSDDLVLFAIAAKSLASKLVVEPSTAGELFPHVYGPINLDAVKSVVVFRTDPATGRYRFPSNEELMAGDLDDLF